MKNLSLTQQYLLCVLNKNGKLPTFGLDKTLCLSAAGVLELLMEDALDFDGKKLTVKSPLPEEKAYLRPVYQVVEKKQPVKFESVVEYFSLAFTDKHMNELIDSIGAALVQKGCVQREEKDGLFGGKDLYIPNEADVDAQYQRMVKKLGDCIVPPQIQEKFPVYAFFVRDPDDYKVEFQRILLKDQELVGGYRKTEEVN